jgi:adenosylcobinamide-GDP ribazoletransferase
MSEATRPQVPPSRSGRLQELQIAFGFLTRLPVGGASGDLAAAGWAFPLAGLAVGLIGAIIYGIAVWLGLTALLSGGLAVAAGLLATGALHEDGLADCADGLGVRGGPSARLAAMRASGIGSYGALALIFTVGLRTVALAALTEPGVVAVALIAAHAGARALLPWAMHRAPWARQDGLAVAAGRPSRATAVAALAIGLVILLLAAGPIRGVIGALAALLALLVLPLARQRIGGITGDVLGAVEQLAEIAILLSLVASR